MPSKTVRPSKARRIIDKWVKTNVREPAWVGMGQIFLFPSRSGEIYLVCWIESYTSRGNMKGEEFLCSCRGWKFSPTDECRHVKELRTQLVEGKANLG